MFLSFNTAPEIMNAMKDIAFVFDCDRELVNLYDGDGRYFEDPGIRTTRHGRAGGVIWHTNMIPDCRKALLDDLEQKVAGGQLTGYRMGEHFPHGIFPPGR